VASNDVTMTGRLIGGRYRLLARRGTGSTSAVFTGVDIRDDTGVAVKLLHPAMAADAAFVERFNVAMGQAMSLDHPNLVKVLGFGIEPVGQRTFLYVVSEQVTGGSLQDIVDRGRLLSPAQALTVGLAVCRGLDQLHRIGIIHRDIRPGSILFDAERVPKVADVGLSGLLAQVAWQEPTSVELDRARFASPEQGEVGAITTATDVYSLALTLVACITGNVPFVGDSTTATLSNRVGRLLPVSADYGALASPLERAARPDPAERTTASEFGRGLMQAAANLDRPEPLPIVSSLAPGEQAPTTRQQPVIDPTKVSPALDPTRPAEAFPAPTTVMVPGPRDPSGTISRPVLFDDDAPPTGRSRRGVWIAVIAAVVVLIAAVGGLLLSRSMRTQTYAVPDLTGLTTGEAQNKIAGNGWEVTISNEQSDAQPADHVIRTDPTVGTKVKEGDPFTMVVSSGPTPSPLPDLAGKTVDEATALLTQAGLVPDVQPPQNDEVVPAGTVLSWQVTAQPMLVAGDPVQKGTAVQVVPSAGPALRSMPDMVNVTLDVAVAALDKRQLVYTTVEAFDDRPAGTVIAQSIPYKTEVDRGTSVELTVSKGPDLVTFPDLTGLDYNGVVTALTNAGFVAGTPPAITSGDTTQPLQQALINGTAATTGATFPRSSAVVNLVYPEPGAPPADTTPPA
jgi:serine/threonine-protein kinase